MLQCTQLLRISSPSMLLNWCCKSVKHGSYSLAFFSLLCVCACCVVLSQGASWPLSGAASVTWCPAGRRTCTWRKPKLPTRLRRDARDKRSGPVLNLVRVAVERGRERRHSRWCEAKPNVVLEMRDSVLLVKPDERSSSLWRAQGTPRRLKRGEWMWCIYRASARWLFDLPASSLPLPTTI